MQPLPVLDKVPAPGGLSSPVVAGDKLVITAFDGGKLYTVAYNRAGGTEAWRREAPAKTIENAVVIEDLHATIYHTLGITPRQSYEVEKRPFYVTRDGLGKPVDALFA